ncbi:hypothetical protein [Oricola sp.]|uniref:hypothetical protein n=1 Tax=Oricola sp. TaxID=1979950 RepID=UPI003BAB30B3
MLPRTTGNLLLALSLISMVMAPRAAWATGEIFCQATDGSGASIDIGIGRVPFLAVLDATATDGHTVWSTNSTGTQIPIIFAQGFMGNRQVLADFSDPNAERIVVSLRLFQASGDKQFAEAGVLSFEGTSVFPVVCESG